MKRVMTLAFLLGMGFVVGCGPSNEAVFEESDDPTAEELAENEAYTEQMEQAGQMSAQGGDKDPFANGN